MGKVQKKIATAFKFLIKNFEDNPEFKKEIKNERTGMVFNARIMLTTEEDESETVSIILNNGDIEVIEGKIENPSITLTFKKVKDLGKLVGGKADDVITKLFRNEIATTGNLIHLNRFFFLLTYVIMKPKEAYTKRQLKISRDNFKSFEEFENWINGTEHMKFKHLGYKIDKVKYLDDPYLSKYNLKDFKRLDYLKYVRSASLLEICPERAKLLTEICRKEGYTPEEGNNDHPGLKMGKFVNYLLSNKKPLIQEWDYLPGTSTTKLRGTMVYPEFGSVNIWPELYTVDERELNPHIIDQEAIDILNYDVFPYWMDKTVREYTRKKYGTPLSQKMDEKFVFYFMFKTSALSHTIPGIPDFFKKGVSSIIKEATEKEQATSEQDKKDFYKGVQLASQGVLNYAENLAREAERKAEEIDESTASELLKTRKMELQNMARILRQVPSKPPETLEEAITSIWIMWIALTHENSHIALSFGRLDHWLQPYFEADMEKITSEEEKEQYIKKAVELMGSFFLRASDQDLTMPNAGNYLFGGSGQDCAMTVGGVDRDGNSAVCDMTFIILKVTEMLTLKDPNMNARYHPGVNSKEYLERLLEVNINARATPSIHNDEKMINALTKVGIPLEDARTWGATGCVEPTICGKHFGHTNCMMFNTIAAMEMALNNGIHPTVSLKTRYGPQTGEVSEFKSFKDFVNAFKAQLHFMIEKSVEYNNILGKVHQILHPSPLLSSLFDGPLDKGKDLVHGGAVYNTSGVAMIGLADIIDTLKVVKTLVYDNKEIDFPTLNEHVRNNFSTPEGELLLKKIKSIPKFGTWRQIFSRILEYE
ncbi:MAG: pyruvate formate lyase family protein [Promethearchaeota archaeon]